MSTLKNTLLIVLPVLAAVILCGGCSQPIPQKTKFTLPNPLSKDRPHRAARMTCLWEPKMLSEKQSITRGFQGEIIFFRDDKMKQSTLVDGELTVYVYDAEDRTITDRGDGVQGIKPLCEYRFDKEALARGMEKNKKTKMISYGVWVPIDKMPGDERNLVLCAKFVGSGDQGELLGTDPGDQINVYLPGNPVERKKKATQPAPESFGGIRQAAYDNTFDFGSVQPGAYAGAVRAMQGGNRTNDPWRDDDAIPMSPALARQLFNASPQERGGSYAASAGSTEMLAQNAHTPRSVGIGFGGGDNPQPGGGYANATPNHTIPAGMSAQFVAGNRQNITSIGEQIDRRMQNSIAQAAAVPRVADGSRGTADGSRGTADVPAAGSYGGIQQVGYAQPNNAATSRLTEMTRIMAEQEQRRRLQDQPVNAQGFTEYNANSFATDQNRITVPNSSWGVPVLNQSQGDFQPNRYPAQTPGTSQPAYAQSDWGPGLESLPSGRETQVIYSPPPAGRIYR